MTSTGSPVLRATTALLAFASPKHQIAKRAAGDADDADEQGEREEQAPVPVRRPTAQRLGAAFVELIERLDPKDLPQAGGVNATVVLGAASQPLDVGRAKRYFTPAQRIAMGIRDGGCTARGCDAPPAMCHAHHDDPWSCHGHTGLTRGRLSCPFHHRRIQDPEYDADVGGDNQVTFHRRS